MGELALVRELEENEEGAEMEVVKDGHLTAEQFKKCLPGKNRPLVTDKLIGRINDLIENSPLRENYRDNLLAYTNILQEGRFKLDDYVNAVMYVSFKLMGDTNIMAYTKTFPERYKRCLDENWNEKDIHSLISAYNRNVMVTKILEQSMVPTWLLNQDLYQKALNVQAELMMTAKSEKVRTDAANSLLAQLKMPEVAKIKIDMTVKEDDSIGELRRSTLELARQQREMIQAGAMNAGEVARQKIVKGRVLENGERE